MTPEQEETLLTTVAAQGKQIAKLEARVDALEAENTKLKHSIGKFIREQERQDAEILELQQLSDSRGKRLAMVQRHLEEEARDALEARVVESTAIET